MAFWKRPAQNEEQNPTEVLPQVSERVGNAGRAGSLEEDLLRRFGRIRSALSPGTIIQGKLSFDSPVRIDGKLTGEVFSSQTLLVGPTGLVSADIEADTVVVLGHLKGTIKANSLVEILPDAHVDARIMAPTLVVHEGAFVQGSCEMGAFSAEKKEDKSDKKNARRS